MSWREAEGTCVIKHRSKKNKYQKLLCLFFLFCNPGVEAGGFLDHFKNKNVQIKLSGA